MLCSVNRIGPSLSRECKRIGGLTTDDYLEEFGLSEQQRAGWTERRLTFPKPNRSVRYMNVHDPTIDPYRLGHLVCISTCRGIMTSPSS